MPEAPPVNPPAGQQQAGQSQQQQTPWYVAAGVPEDMHAEVSRYNSAADFAKGYKELRTKLGGNAQQQQQPAQGQQNALSIAAQESGEEADLPTFIQSVGLKQADIAAQWEEHGELTPDQYAAFRKKGVPKSAVNHMLTLEAQNRSFVAEKVMNEARAAAGGEQQLNNLLAWARQPNALSEDDRNTYETLRSNPKTTRAAVEWLNAKYANAAGAGGSRAHIEGGSSQGGGAMAFRTQAEWTAARNHPDYIPGTPHYEKTRARFEATPDIRTLPPV